MNHQSPIHKKSQNKNKIYVDASQPLSDANYPVFIYGIKKTLTVTQIILHRLENIDINKQNKKKIKQNLFAIRHSFV